MTTPPQKSRSPLNRLAWFLACLTLGIGIGVIGFQLSNDSSWFLAVPAVLAVGWLFIANPDECLPCGPDGDRRSGRRQ